MLIYHTLSFLLVSIASGIAVARPTTPSKNASIEWFSCQQNVSSPVSCGTIAVPLDYTDPNCNTTINVQLTKFNATEHPVKGSILFNPGGPGDSTREFLANFNKQMMM
jgi:hypothetical protein